MKISKILSLICILLYSSSRVLASELKFNKIESHIVKIESSSTLVIYGSKKEVGGLGCVINKIEGLILTTKDVVNYPSISKYEVTFHTGQKVQASLKYFDQWINLAILKVDPKLIPKECSEAQIFSSQKMGKNRDNTENVYIVNQNQNFPTTLVSGKIIEKSAIYADPLPFQATKVQPTIEGNFGSSPIFNDKGELVSICCGVQGGIVYFIDNFYINSIISEKIIKPNLVRKHIGVIIDLYSLHDGVNYREIPKEVLEKYIQNFPNSKGNILIVKDIINGSPCQNILKIGDIIFSINKKQPGCDLKYFDAEFFNENENIQLEVIRNGKIMELIVPSYDLELYKIKKIINFCSGIFFESDEKYSLLTGINLGRLTLLHSKNNNTFRRIICIQNSEELIFVVDNLEMNQIRMSQLTDLKLAIPKLLEKKDFLIKYKNILPLPTAFSEIYKSLTFNQQFCSFISIDQNDIEADLYEYKSSENNWAKISLL